MKLFPTFRPRKGDDVIQTVAGVSWIPKIFFGGEKGLGYVFYV